MEFEYLLEKIESSIPKLMPFRCVYIEDFLTDEHFRKVIQAKQIDLNHMDDDRALLNELDVKGWSPIPFPGTATNAKEYLSWRRGKTRHTNVETCEGFGITFRLHKISDPILSALNSFFTSSDFLTCLEEKFGLSESSTYLDSGIQKYLDGYEISPHPDIRKKALTYMLNVNPAQNSEVYDFHTQYLEFVDCRRYVEEFWKGNNNFDRCWVPWEWCKPKFVQKKNNSIVIFSPSSNTVHAVKAKYDHLATQRTQFYGNLWFCDDPKLEKPNWRDLDISASGDVIAYEPPHRKFNRVMKGLINKVY